MKTKVNPTSKEILKLLGIGVIVTASVLMPGLPMVLKPVLDFQKKKEKYDREKYWSKYNYSRLNKLLKINLQEITLQKPAKWDGKWRLIIYDVKKDKRSLGEVLRRFLRKLYFLKLQRSAYLTPF